MSPDTETKIMKSKYVHLISFDPQTSHKYLSTLTLFPKVKSWVSSNVLPSERGGETSTHLNIKYKLVQASERYTEGKVNRPHCLPAKEFPLKALSSQCLVPRLPCELEGSAELC